MIDNEMNRFKAKLISTNNLKAAKYVGEKFDCSLGVFLYLVNELSHQIRTSLVKDTNKNDYPLLKIKTLNSTYELEVIEED